MAINQKKNWLIAYDIADPKRLGKIHRHIKNHALPVQYSLYLYQGTQKQVNKLLDELAEKMHLKYDDLRAYPIPKNPEIEMIGQAQIEEGMILAGSDTEELLKFFHSKQQQRQQDEEP